MELGEDVLRIEPWHKCATQRPVNSSNAAGYKSRFLPFFLFILKIFQNLMKEVQAKVRWHLG